MTTKNPKNHIPVKKQSGRQDRILYSWNRVVAAGMKRVTAHDALERQPAALPWPIFFNGNARVFRACRNIAAARHFQRRNTYLIKRNEKQDEFLYHHSASCRIMSAFLPKSRKAFSMTGCFTATAGLRATRRSHISSLRMS